MTTGRVSFFWKADPNRMMAFDFTRLSIRGGTMVWNAGEATTACQLSEIEGISMGVGSTPLVNRHGFWSRVWGRS